MRFILACLLSVFLNSSAAGDLDLYVDIKDNKDGTSTVIVTACGKKVSSSPVPNEVFKDKKRAQALEEEIVMVYQILCGAI